MSFDEIPRSFDEVSQFWVEKALNQGMTLPSFRLEPIEANNSTTARIIFADHAQKSTVPKSVVLKLCPSGHGFCGASEPNFYSRDYVDMSPRPIVESYGAIWSGAATSQSVGHGYALFLEDLSVDYTNNLRIKPNAAHAANLGRALGLLHAHRWGSDADLEGKHDLSADLQRFLSHVSNGLEPILDELGDGLDKPSRARLTKLFTEDADRMLRRALEGEGVTLVHGDPNPTNVLTRKIPDQNLRPLYLIDRQPFEWSLRLWLGASDLIYAAVPFWSEEHRRALQKILLRSYHRTLIANGVCSYSWEDLLQDWEICACMAAFTAIEWGSNPVTLKEMKPLWQLQLQRALVLLKDCEAGFD